MVAQDGDDGQAGTHRRQLGHEELVLLALPGCKVVGHVANQKQGVHWSVSACDFPQEARVDGLVFADLQGPPIGGDHNIHVLTLLRAHTTT